MDGGSTDGAVEVIRKYEPWLTYWVSEKDGGQSSAINSGLEMATGELMNWINSDDWLNMSALKILGIAAAYARQCHLFTGYRHIVNEGGEIVGTYCLWLTRDLDYMFGIPDFPQEATFFTSQIWKEIGGLRNELVYAMDTDLYRQALARASNICCIDFALGAIRIHKDMKTLAKSERRKSEGREQNKQINGTVTLYLLSKRMRLERLLFRIGILSSPIKLFAFHYQYDSYEEAWKLRQLHV
jgi:glycosyltransferase involved in cell wall biosynthesis